MADPESLESAEGAKLYFALSVLLVQPSFQPGRMAQAVTFSAVGAAIN
jgi:hypothetical protein